MPNNENIIMYINIVQVILKVILKHTSTTKAIVQVNTNKFHFRWYAYDGLKEYHEHGTGTASILTAFSPPGANFHKDYAVFVRDRM